MGGGPAGQVTGEIINLTGFYGIHIFPAGFGEKFFCSRFVRPAAINHLGVKLHPFVFCNGNDTSFFTKIRGNSPGSTDDLRLKGIFARGHDGIFPHESYDTFLF